MEDPRGRRMRWRMCRANLNLNPNPSPSGKLLLAAVFTAIILVLCSCAYFNTFYNARKSYDAARELAIASPENPTYMEAELLDRAITGAVKVLTRYPDSRWADDAQLLLADALLLSGERSLTGSGTSDLEEAMMAYAAVVVMTDDRTIRDMGHIGIGRAAFGLGRYNDAIASFESVSAGDDKLFFASRLELIEALLLDDKPETALQVADSLSIPDSDSLAAELMLVEGRALTALGFPDSGAVLALEAGDLFGRGHGAYRALTTAAASYILADKPFTAVEVLNTLLSTHRSDLETAAIVLLEGKAREIAGDPDRAVTSYLNAADLDSYSEYGAEALYLRALLLEDADRTEDALADLTRLAQRGGGYLWIRMGSNRIHDLQLLSDYSEALGSADEEDIWMLQVMIAEKRIDLYGQEDPEALVLLETISTDAPDMERAMAMVRLADLDTADPDVSRTTLLEVLELAAEGDLATDIESYLGLEPGPSYHLRPSVVLNRAWGLISEERYQEAWTELNASLGSRWSESVRPELLWAAYVAAEAARMDDNVMEDYLNELVEEHSDSEYGLTALNRLGGIEGGEEEE